MNDNKNDNKNEKSISFKDTLNLPVTDFPIRANLKEEDKAVLDRWQKEDLYTASFDVNNDQKKYILHDGPPYANGHIHLGHAYNKILKDIVAKSRRMMGYHVPVIPGWDCHGLPIEIKVSQENPGLNSLELKKSCRNYAQEWINIQREEFKQLGILMDWQRPYITMDPHYEAMTVRAFGKLVKREYIERKNKTVAWCFSCKTTLASAEIEYKDRKDPSIFVLFALEKLNINLNINLDEPVYILVWTTTPWTLPLNRAVLVNSTGNYVLLNLKNKKIIVGSEVADKIVAMLGEEKKVIKEFNASVFKNSLVQHPFIKNFNIPLILDDSVGTTEGTAFVHCAPGCGPIDYEIGVKNSLEIFSPITADGKYSEGINPSELENMSVVQGQGWVINKLLENNNLLYKTSINHSYPHCWRCHNGLIFRATPQWFFDLNKDHVQEQALKAIEKINFIPEQGKNFLKATVAHRWEWCLSRQRVWGIPIPALLCKHCDFVYITPEFIESIANGIESEGIEYWDKVKLQELIDADITCKNCNIKDFIKETDILDVWFDSGVSHYAVLFNNPEQKFPADIYLEGVDQHRGWFQSSLLTSMVLEQEPSMKTIMTHGYTVDEKGQKMSKSKGNVVDPKDIIDKLGTDGLRLWVASIGHDSDPIVSKLLLDNIAEVYRKIRNTCRFMLSNLYDFNIHSDSVIAAQLTPIDRRALEQLYELNNSLIIEYSKGNFTAVFHNLAEYCAVDLSSGYLDIIKDRLYVEKSNGQLRRSAQTTIYYILDTLTKLIAPIMSFSAELISDQYQENKKASIHLQQFMQPKFLHSMLNLGDEYLPENTMGVFELGSLSSNTLISLENMNLISRHNAEWDRLHEIRSLVLKSIELLREQAIVKQSMEVKVNIYIDLNNSANKILQEFIKDLKNNNFSIESFLKEFFIVSQVNFNLDNKNLDSTSQSGVWLKVEKADGVKCPRCWQWDITDNQYNLCRRCQAILQK